MTLREFCYLIVLLSFAIQGYGDVVFSADYRIGGMNPEALLCRPEGKGPFPAVIHNHGVGVDTFAIKKPLNAATTCPPSAKSCQLMDF